MKTQGLCCIMFLLLGHSLISEGMIGVGRTCPNRVWCFAEPCSVARCSNFKLKLMPSLRCVNDYCGGCFARWFIGNYEVTVQCRAPLPYY